MTLLLDRCAAPTRLDALALLPTRGKLVVVAPHPDDETLAVGGLIAEQAKRGGNVLVVGVTDGEGAFPSWPELASIRRDEQRQALDELGTSSDVIRLGLPDSDVGHHVEALTGQIEAVLSPDDLLVTPSPHDWHPDHVACAQAATAAAITIGADILYWLFWTHHHPDQLVQHQTRLIRVALSVEARDRRRAAVARHRSQIEPPGLPSVVTHDDMAHLDEPAEYFHR